MFITFEGIEGSGKTTQINHTVRFLEGKGRTCVVTREPGDTRIGKKIRQILLDPENRELVPQAELFLYAADRAQHIHERILPALKAGHDVVCDRFYDATTAYQGYARGIDLDMIQALHKQVLGTLKPDLTILFDLDPRIGLERAWKEIDRGGRADNETRFEHEALAFHDKVRAGYLELAAREPHRITIIDASLNKDEVSRTIARILSTHLQGQELNPIPRQIP
ncbi:MAG: dTMP kinase [Proteobacteria bacterium]|nr:dTMP kinase [Pseudomonadota bacterium]